jgi:hypothetical protein
MEHTATCNQCGRTDWLLLKDEHRFYYAKFDNTNMKWIELTARKHVSPYKLICAKCEKTAEEVASLDYVIKTRPALQVVWQTRFWKQFLE